MAVAHNSTQILFCLLNHPEKVTANEIYKELPDTPYSSVYGTLSKLSANGMVDFIVDPYKKAGPTERRFWITEYGKRQLQDELRQAVAKMAWSKVAHEARVNPALHRELLQGGLEAMAKNGVYLKPEAAEEIFDQVLELETRSSVS